MISHVYDRGITLRLRLAAAAVYDRGIMYMTEASHLPPGRAELAPTVHDT